MDHHVLGSLSFLRREDWVTLEHEVEDIRVGRKPPTKVELHTGLFPAIYREGHLLSPRPEILNPDCQVESPVEFYKTMKVKSGTLH